MLVIFKIHKIQTSIESAGKVTFMRSDEITVTTNNKDLTDSEIESAFYSALWAMNEAGCFTFVADNERIFVNDVFIYDHVYHLLRKI